MKKVLALILSLALLFAVAACGGGKDTPQPSPTGSASPSPSEPGNGIAKEDLKIGFVHISDPSDKGYTFNHDLGTWKMVEALGLSEDQIINKYNVGRSSRRQSGH
jgi:basic membrane protein A